MLTGSCHCGQCSWEYTATPDQATACNCTVCRRYGVLWIYDWEGEGVSMSGPTTFYAWDEKSIEFHFCPTCGNVISWRAAKPDEDGRKRMAVNVRLSAPETVAHLPIRHFDGFETWQDQPDDGRTVHDMWY